MFDAAIGAVPLNVSVVRVTVGVGVVAAVSFPLPAAAKISTRTAGMRRIATSG